MRIVQRALPSKLLRSLGVRELPLRMRRVTQQAKTNRIYSGIAHIAAKYVDSTSLTAHEYKVFSQNGEDGVLAEIFHRIGTTNRCFVEFGAEEGIECNAAFLANVCDWTGLFIEADDDSWEQLHSRYRFNDQVSTLKSLVTPANIDQLLADNAVPPEPDLLSIDIDGNDYWVWQAITGVKPRVVVIEYNSSIDPRAGLVQPYTTDAWDKSDFFGASLGALVCLAETKGYRLVHTELAGVNAFFVRDELAGHFSNVVVPTRSPNYYLRGGHHPADTQGRSYVAVDTVKMPEH